MATGPVVWVNREVGMENWWEGKIFPAAESGGRYLVGKAVRSTSAQPVLSFVSYPGLFLCYQGTRYEVLCVEYWISRALSTI